MVTPMPLPSVFGSRDEVDGWHDGGEWFGRDKDSSTIEVTWNHVLKTFP